MFGMSKKTDDLFPIGYEFDEIGDNLICQKYISPSTKKAQGTQKSSKKIENQMFHQHFDTAQFGRNDSMIKENDLVIITEKLHGTSQRVANVKVQPDPKWYQKLFNVTPKPIWVDMIGTRRVILGENKIKDDNGFHPTEFRVRASKGLLGNLKKGETFYYEVVGYESEDGKPIMGRHFNEKLKGFLDKESYKNFIETFGRDTVFSYGCSEGELDIYVYRITLTNEDGYSVDLSWDAVVDRCKELGVKSVPELWRGTRIEMAIKLYNGFDEYGVSLASTQFIKNMSSGKSTIGHNLKEGVCLRVERGITPLVLKEKNFEFKCLEGIIKDLGDVDTEEAEG
jgi:hypothetical protein